MGQVIKFTDYQELVSQDIAEIEILWMELRDDFLREFPNEEPTVTDILPHEVYEEYLDLIKKRQQLLRWSQVGEDMSRGI